MDALAFFTFLGISTLPSLPWNQRIEKIVRMYEWLAEIDGWTDGWMGGWSEGWIGMDIVIGLRDGQRNGWRDGWRGRWRD